MPQSDVSNPHAFDVIILGGGLAGGCLARQLRMEAPSLRVLVAEKRRHPVPEAAFKVGESSVEIGAHYFHSRLNLAAHLRSGHLEKLGLRYFFPDGDNRDITRRVEVGPLRFSPVPSFQLDRGRLENYLLKMNAENGVTVLDGCRVQDFELNPGGMHQVTIATEDGVIAFSARWVVDASGRAGLIKRRLGLVKSSTHGANASWWRFNTRLKIDDWSEDPAWKARVSSGLRWHSTVHLMGAGYWVWLIPLGNGSHSFGIVADAEMHPFSRINRFERALDWLREFEPQCAEVVERNAGNLEDFLALQHFAHSCARVFSGDRWALVGEAGVFTDPFYSPGSDFIAIGNDYVTDLIARDAAGEAIVQRAESFNTMYLRLFDGFIRLYDGQYRIMGNAQAMTAKVSWDNACYWAINALLFFNRRYCRPEFMQTIEPLMRRFFVLHARMQAFFREWDRLDTGARYANSMHNIVGVDFLNRLQTRLAGPMMDDAALQQHLDDNYSLLERFARTWQAVAAERYPQIARFVSPARGDESPLDVRLLLPERAESAERAKYDCGVVAAET